MSQTVHSHRPKSAATPGRNTVAAPAPARGPDRGQERRRGSSAPADDESVDVDVDVRAGGMAAQAAVEEVEPTVSGRDALEWLWRFFISRRTGLVLILVLGLLSLIGTLLAQAPAEVRADPQAYASWVNSMHGKYGGWTGILNALGLFSTFSSIWFKGTLVLLTTSILACSVHRAPPLWRKATRPRLEMHEGFYDRAALHGEVSASGTPEQAAQQVRNALRHAHFRAVEAPRRAGRSGIDVYGDRFRWSPFGSIAAHLGFVVVLAGAFLSATTGFKDAQFTAPVDAKVAVGHGTGLTVQALAFSDSYYPDGSPKDYASDLVVYKNGKAVAHQTVRVNQPLSVDGVSFYQSFFGTAASLQVKDPSGKVLADTSVPLAWTSDDGRHSIGQLAVPGQPISVYVVAPASGLVDPNIQAGQVQLEIYQQGNSNTPIATQVITQGKPVTLAGLSYTFVRERQFTGLIVARDPGAMLVWAGATLLIGGIVLVFFFPHRRVWVRIRRTESGGSTIRCASHLRRDAAFEPQFRSLVAGIETAAAAPTGRK